MKIVATSDYIMDLGSGPEVVKRGQEFAPIGNGIQSADDRARVLLAQRVAVLPKDWPVYRDRTEKQFQAVAALVAAARKGRQI